MKLFKLATTAALALGLSLGSVAPAFAEGKNVTIGDLLGIIDNANKKKNKKVAQDSACFLYQHANFKGDELRIPPNTNPISLGKFNDRASSAKTTGTCSMVMYQHSNYKGSTRGVLGKDSGGWGIFNDSASSAKCSC